MSPLATTAILLVVSIIIGIVVMTWGRSYVEQATLPEVQKVATDESIFTELNDRLARGEITQEQYDKIKEVLIKNNG